MTVEKCSDFCRRPNCISHLLIVGKVSVVRPASEPLVLGELAMLWSKSVLEALGVNRKSRSKKVANRSRKRSNFRLGVERLEARQLMAGDISHNSKRPSMSISRKLNGNLA